jgi:hypothetical protein
MNIVKSSIILALITVTAALQTAAKDKKQKDSKGPKDEAVAVAQPQVEASVSAPEGPASPPPGALTMREKRIIQDYVEGSAVVTPRGRASHRLPASLVGKTEEGVQLPPGWQKTVYRGAILPLPIFTQSQALPREITVRLPAQPPGTQLVAVQGYIVRIVEKTHEILDVYNVTR